MEYDVAPSYSVSYVKGKEKTFLFFVRRLFESGISGPLFQILIGNPSTAS
jgi:hypothetical protein